MTARVDAQAAIREFFNEDARFVDEEGTELFWIPVEAARAIAARLEAAEARAEAVERHNVGVTVDAQAASDPFAAEREEIRKADAGLASEPWGVRGLLHELDALAARLEAAETALREVCDYGDRAAVTIARAALAAGRGEHG